MYKVKITQYKEDGTFIGNCVLCEDFSSRKAAIKAAREHSLSSKSECEIRKYADDKLNIISFNHQDTGTVVETC